MGTKLCFTCSETRLHIMILIHLLFPHSRLPHSDLTLAAHFFPLSWSFKTSDFLAFRVMEKVQYLTRSAIRRASTIEMPQQARQNLQNLFINFCLILICLLLICIIVMLLWSAAATSSAATCRHQRKPVTHGEGKRDHFPWRGNSSCKD